MRRLCLTVLALLGTLLVSSCQKRESVAEQGTRVGVLHVGNGAEPADLDPHQVNALTDMNILNALFEGLTVLDEGTSRPLPGVASSWQVSPDGLVWTFQLRDGALWSDGSALTAEDFVWSFRRILAPKLASPNAYLLWPLKNARSLSDGKIRDFDQLGAKSISAHTLELTLEAPCPWFATLVSNPPWFPVKRATIEKFGAWDERGTRWTRPENMVCNGPFLLKEWALQSRLIVEANPHYWDTTRSSLRQIIFYPGESIATDERSFRTGQLHVTYDLPPSKIDTYRKESPESLRIDSFYETFLLKLNQSKAPLNKPEVRRALSIALSRRSLCEAVLRGSRPPAYSLAPSLDPKAPPGVRIKEDADAARALLSQAGFPGGKGFPELEIQYKSDDIHKAVVEAIQQMWLKELGVRSTLAPLEQKTWLSNQATSSYQVSTYRWVGDYLNPNTFLELWLADSGNNQTNWSDRIYDRLVGEAARTLDDTRRTTLQQQAEQILIDQSPIIPIFHGARVYLINPSVKNWHAAPLGLRRFQFVKLQAEPGK